METYSFTGNDIYVSDPSIGSSNSFGFGRPVFASPGSGTASKTLRFKNNTTRTITIAANRIISTSYNPDSSDYLTNLTGGLTLTPGATVTKTLSVNYNFAQGSELRYHVLGQPMFLVTIGTPVNNGISITGFTPQMYNINDVVSGTITITNPTNKVLTVDPSFSYRTLMLWNATLATVAQGTTLQPGESISFPYTYTHIAATPRYTKYAISCYWYSDFNTPQEQRYQLYCYIDHGVRGTYTVTGSYSVSGSAAWETFKNAVWTGTITFHQRTHQVGLFIPRYHQQGPSVTANSGGYSASGVEDIQLSQSQGAPYEGWGHTCLQKKYYFGLRGYPDPSNPNPANSLDDVVDFNSGETLTFSMNGSYNWSSNMQPSIMGIPKAAYEGHTSSFTGLSTSNERLIAVGAGDCGVWASDESDECGPSYWFNNVTEWKRGWLETEPLAPNTGVAQVSSNESGGWRIRNIGLANAYIPFGVFYEWYGGSTFNRGENLTMRGLPGNYVESATFDIQPAQTGWSGGGSQGILLQPGEYYDWRITNPVPKSGETISPTLSTGRIEQPYMSIGYWIAPGNNGNISPLGNQWIGYKYWYIYLVPPVSTAYWNIGAIAG